MIVVTLSDIANIVGVIIGIVFCAMICWKNRS